MENLNAAQQLQAVGFDVSSYTDVHTGAVTIKNPETGAPTPLVIELAGPEHPTRKRDAFNKARRARQDMMKTGKVQLGDPEEEDAEVTEKLAEYTLGWTGLVIGGQPVQYSRQAALQLYGDPKLRWLRAQVKAALEETERFIKRSANS